MIEICEKDLCSGCHACVNICPKQCIHMEYDERGILLPKIESTQCIDCHACEKVCPVNHPVEQHRAEKAYAVWHLDEHIRRTSASGGAAMALYETMLEKGGVCYGTRFDSDLNLTIQPATTKEQVHSFRGSKYVQATVGDSFQSVRSHLEEGKPVLYIGTPCQIAGLKNYLQKDYEQLITVDLVCHGVPSLQSLRVHIDSISERIGEQITNVTFRGHHDFQLILLAGEEMVYQKDRYQDPYFTGFLNGLFYRPNCYTCLYACPDRVSDLTIGDFWGLGAEIPFEHPRGNGISVVLPNTEKGVSFLEETAPKLFMEQRPYTEAIQGNSQLMHPSERNRNTGKFWKKYQRYGFEKAAESCTKWYRLGIKIQNICEKILRKSKRVIKKWLKRG